MLALILKTPKKSQKSFITNEKYSVFIDSLFTSTSCTFLRDSISGFGIMKKTIFCMSLLLTNLCNADTILGVFAGAQYWYADNSTNINANSQFYLANEDFNLNHQANSSLFVALEHPIPFVPNIKIRKTNFSTNTNDSSTSSDTLCITVIPNPCFPNGIELNLSHSDFTLYYELLDNWINLDLGLSAIYFDGKTRISALSQVNYSKIVPALYAKTMFEFPISNLSASLTANVGSLSNTSISDIELAAEYKLGLGFSLEAGYRKQNIDLKGFDEIKIESNASGFFSALNFHF